MARFSSLCFLGLHGQEKTPSTETPCHRRPVCCVLGATMHQWLLWGPHRSLVLSRCWALTHGSQEQ